MSLTIIEKVIKGTCNNAPIWLMRQAGRYLKEYKEVRNSTNSFLEFCYDYKKASEVTLQPIRRFDFDAAIIFSDILVIPDAMGVNVDFKKGEGPLLQKITLNDIEKLKYNRNHLSPVYKAIKEVRKELAPEKTLIGFAGAAWTIATYMVEGGSSKDFQNIKTWAYSSPQSFKKLIYYIADGITDHAIAQVESGVNVLQIFDSWAGAVAAGKEYEEWVIKPTEYIISKIKKIYPEIPVIGFPKGSGISYLEYIKNTGIDAVSIDSSIPIEWAEENIDITIQGNLDPVLLKANKEQAIKEAKRILDVMKNHKFIFNLGHGILPETPVENVYALVEEVKSRR